MAKLQLIRIKNGVETILEETVVPRSFRPSMVFHSLEHIKKLEKHYRRTGKAKKGGIDVLYITRRQTERVNEVGS